MDDHRRTIEIQRDSVNVEAGTFEAVVFTGGEASDGHILNVRGGDIPDQIPLFVNHFPDPESQLGSLYPVRTTRNEVVMRGEILTDGEGAAADVRRDLLLKMATGHVHRMSGRWDADEANVTQRTRLPKDHPAHVSESTKGPKRWGLYFDQWRAMEGSVVGLGADPAALVRFQQDEESPEAVREFWRGVQPDKPEPAEEPEADSVAVLADAITGLREMGFDSGDILTAVRQVLGLEPEVQPEPITERLDWLELTVGDLSAKMDSVMGEASRKAADEPVSPVELEEPTTPPDLGEIVRDAVQAHESRLEQRLDEMLRSLTGRR